MSNKKTAVIIITILLVILGVFALIVRPVSILGVSMEPSYLNGERYLSKRLSYLFSLPQRLDVVVLHYDASPEYKVISRVIGLPGEKIMIKGGNVYVNGSQISESYIFTQNKTFIKNNSVVIEQGSLNKTPNLDFIKEGTEITIPAENYFVMGDNREYSYDSRVLGFVKKENIESKVEIKY